MGAMHQMEKPVIQFSEEATIDIVLEKVFDLYEVVEN